MNNDILLSRIQTLCQSRGISMTTAFTESGVGKNFKCNLKIANPSEGKITMLANYFNVSVGYLKGETDTPTPITSNAIPLSPERTYNTADLSPQKQEIQTALDAMTPEQLEQIYSYIQFIKSQKK